MELPPHIASAAADFAARVRARFGERVQLLSLFGSYARGEQDEDSDLDICVVVDDLKKAEQHEIWMLALDVTLAHDNVVEVSALAMSTAHMQFLRGRELLIAEDIDREGIAI